jgi:hypothetical protein
MTTVIAIAVGTAVGVVLGGLIVVMRLEFEIESF